ncbi:MAG: hypothetical protein QF657_06735, partial [Candidatus Nitrosopelagicus sp.]|nr:hypothetical protein [Candidatus Nitrosopelagicus sp.]
VMPLGDVDYFKIDIPSAGVLSVSLPKTSTRGLRLHCSIFDEEKNVADKAPVEGVNIVNISSENLVKKKVIKLTKKFSYVIKIADFYYEDSAKLVKERIMTETNIKKIKILLNPDGIDLSSGVEETPGIKSTTKINNLIKKFYKI